ncbi:right-handed parallel beta-helix repeat-containing protein [Brachybacterium sp. AOP43-C2-M15]|uniref:right-handed parallel beta-helix repeat-containing protein n=1 Tax=Brachybacterium sp. AOP43-C2-M15 TaxID=3457661 RepID=UPI004034B6EF
MTAARPRALLSSMSLLRSVSLLIITSVLASAALLPGARPALAEGSDGPPVASGDGVEYPGDPARESAEARAEERRLTDVATMVDSTRWAFPTGAAPLTLPSGDSSTVVLLAREAPYTLEELADLVPEAVEREADGAYLISSHLVVDRGATLRIHDDSGLVVRLESTSESFASIVSLGGVLDIAGAEEEPVEISGWDSSRRTADDDTSDGRAYIRALAGSVDARDVDLRSLGFWSGPTGGLALTGSDSPRIETASGEVIADPEEASAVEPDPSSPVLLPDPDEEKEDRTVSASLERVSARGAAIGVFAANTAQLRISDSDFSHNLLDGVVLHRFVTAAQLTEVTAHSNGGDGIRAGRGTTDVSIDGAEVSGNRGNGITLDGAALADGPGATGIATGVFGGHAVTGSSVAGNGRYGIQVTGGAGMVLRDNSVSRHTSGIVVNGTASETEVSGNRVRFSTQHGISLRDDVTDALIRGNTVSGADTAIYTRGSSGEIAGNTISRTTNHGITVIDQSDTTTVSRNSIAGSGPAAIDSSRSGTSVVLIANSAAQWEVTKPLPVILQRIFQPLTVLWLTIAVLLAATAGATVRRGPGRGPRTHPYADHTPLLQLSAGVVPETYSAARPGPAPSPAAHGRRRRPGAAAGPVGPVDTPDTPDTPESADTARTATRGGLHP